MQGPLLLEQGLGVYYAIIIIRNTPPQKKNLIIKAPMVSG